MIVRVSVVNPQAVRRVPFDPKSLRPTKLKVDPGYRGLLDCRVVLNFGWHLVQEI